MIIKCCLVSYADVAYDAMGEATFSSFHSYGLWFMWFMMSTAIYDSDDSWFFWSRFLWWFRSPMIHDSTIHDFLDSQFLWLVIAMIYSLWLIGNLECMSLLFEIESKWSEWILFQRFSAKSNEKPKPSKSSLVCNLHGHHDPYDLRNSWFWWSCKFQ